MKDFLSNELICCSSISGSLDMCILKFKTWFCKANFHLSETAVNGDKVAISGTAVMAGNDTFYQKSITGNRKTVVTRPKHMIFC